MVGEAVPKEDSGPRIFLLAGEPSGDLLGARLMAALSEETGGQVNFIGVGGQAMIDQGLDSLYPLEDFAVMGLVEVLPHVARLHGRVRDLARRIADNRPDALVTIDAPAFTLAVAKRLKGRGIPLIHYVAPSVWAWKPWRAKRLAGTLDKLLTLLPFEPPYFTRHGLEAVFVGHPASEPQQESQDRDTARARLGLASGDPLLCLFPGSRRGEIDRMLPVFVAVAAALQAERPDLAVVLPTLPHLVAPLRDALAGLPLAPRLLVEPGEKAAAVRAADLALAASGTVVVELASQGVPTVVAHRVHPISAWLARRLLKVKSVTLPNILLDEPVVPEFLQERCRVDAIVPVLKALLADPAAAARQKEAFVRFIAALRPPGGSPSRQAAREILATISQRRQ